MGAPTNGERRVELYVRSLAPGGTHSQQDTVVRRLDDLLDAGAIADYDVRVWGDRIRRASAVARTVDGQHVQDRLARMERWADRAGYSLDGIYREVDHECTITDESWTEVRFPQIALAEFVDDELVHLAPAYEDGDGDLVEVADRLADLDAPTTDGDADDSDADDEDDAGDEDRRVEAGGVEH